jgi:regulatory protein
MEFDMATITGISESPRKEGRYVLLVDGKPHATVSLEIIERLKLAVGRTLDGAAGEAVEREAAALRTYDRALNVLAFRARSSAELRRTLVRKGEAAADVDAAIAKLLAAGLLDDAQFARQFAQSKAVGQGLSRRRLQQELFRKGVAREVADDAIEETMADEAVDEGEMIERAARKKLRTLAKLDGQTRRRRLFSYLARRGYETDDIRRVMDALARGGDESGGDEGDGDEGAEGSGED